MLKIAILKKEIVQYKPTKGGYMVDKNDLDEKKDGDDGEGEGGKGGKTGEIVYRYRDAYSLEPRDDQLPPAEQMKSALANHKHKHLDIVRKQKGTREERAIKKEKGADFAAGMYRFGASGGGAGTSNLKKHFLADTVQYGTGATDKNMSALPADRDNLKTNKEAENRLDARPELGLTQRPSPRPGPPRPQGPG